MRPLTALTPVEIAMSNENNELLQPFVDASLTHLADIGNDLLFMEKGGADLDEASVHKVFRVVHLIKDSAGFVGLTVVKDLSQAIENVLGLIRGRKLMPTPAVINVLLLAVEALQKLLANALENNATDIGTHLAALQAVAVGRVSMGTSPSLLDETMQPAAEEPAWMPMATAEQVPPAESVISEAVPTPNVSSRQAENEVMMNTATEPVGLDSPPTQADASLRVSVSLLDQLMNLAGELVLSRNQLLQTISTGSVHEAEAVGQRIDLVTSELQEAIMLTRMQPIGNVFGKFPRVVRDLSKRLGKQLDLTIVGQEVELDKTIIERLGDPLTHLIRNGVVHGIETPEERVRKGKPRRGTVLLKAYHAAGQVVIEIHDDGKGIDGDLVAATALARGLVTAEQAKVMSTKERVNLILLPGFSTAREATDSSGRSVGMNMVQANLNHLGGSIDIESTVGKSTTISIKLPLTLAIIPCQIIMTGDERYAIPQVNLEELLRIPAVQIKERIERVGDAEVVRLRGNLLPLIRMADVLTIERTYYDDEQARIRIDRRSNIADRRSKNTPLFASATQTSNRSYTVDEEAAARRGQPDRRQSPASALNIVVVSTGVIKYGLIVDCLLDSEEIVIKPLGRHLQQCQGYAGATIMGDGRIALILDVANLARMAGLTSLEGSKRAMELAEVARDSQAKSRGQQSLLIFRSSSTEQFGVPLHLVERVEKIRQDEIEMLGNGRVLQYRGGSLPLVRLDDTASVLPLVEQENLLVIVFHLMGKDVGLLASGPVDAVEVSSEIDVSTLRQPGIMGSAIISGKTTLLVDIFEIVQSVHPEWCPSSASQEEWAEGECSATV